MSSREKVDALFVSYYEDVDRWHNDHLGADASAISATGLRPDAPRDPDDPAERNRLVRQSVGIGGGLLDLPRFLSWVACGSTADYRDYHPFALTHLSGSYLTALAASRGHDMRHVNFANRTTLPELAQRYDPRWVFLSTTFLSETIRILDACQRLRRIWPDAGLVLGGLVLLELQKSVGAAAFEKLLRAWGADAYVLSPQGEDATLTLLEHEPGELARLELPATLVRRNGGYAPAGAREERHFPLDQNPVHWGLLDPAGLYHAVHTRTARSCAFRCTFCTFPQLQGALELMSPEAFEQELVDLGRSGSVRSLIFTDDTFNVPPERFQELCRVLARHDFEWYSFFRPQFCDAETARLMRASGCKAVFLGIESVDDEMLKRMGKPAGIDKVRRGIRHLEQEGIALHANFIIGFPGDVPENTQKIVDLLDDHAIDFFYASPWYHSETAPIAKHAAEYGVEGRFYRWKHDTMTAEQAMELEKQVQHAPRRAQFMSEYTQFTFWGEIMLYANGYSVDDARLLISAFNAFTGRDTPAASLRADPRIAKARELLARKPFPRPPDVSAADITRRGISDAGAG